MEQDKTYFWWKQTTCVFISIYIPIKWTKRVIKTLENTGKQALQFVVFLSNETRMKIEAAITESKFAKIHFWSIHLFPKINFLCPVQHPTKDSSSRVITLHFLLLSTCTTYDPRNLQREISFCPAHNADLCVPTTVDHASLNVPGVGECTQ